MPSGEPHTRAAVIAEARRWLGTPYHHQASLIGVGTDCIGLVRGVWRAFYGAEPETLPGYSRDWAEAIGHETLIETARRHLVEVAPEAVRPGDVLVFRYRAGSIAKHAGIVASVASRDLDTNVGLSDLERSNLARPPPPRGEGLGVGGPIRVSSQQFRPATAHSTTPDVNPSITKAALDRTSASRSSTAASVATFIHAVEGAPVTEVPLIAWWRRRVAAAFSFPGIID